MPTIANQPITRGDIRIKEQGDWFADISTNSGERIADGTRVDIIAGTLVLSGAIVRGGITESVGRYQVAGRPEWLRQLPARPSNAYQSAGSVLRKTVFSDIARETLGSNWQRLVVAPPAANLGGHYERIGANGDVTETAADALRRLGLSWYVRNDGITVFGTRASGDVATTERILVEYRNDAIGYRVAHCEDIAAFTPGLTFEGEVIAEVTYAISADDVKAHLWSRASANGPVDWLRAAWRRLFPRAELQGVYSYVVAEAPENGKHTLRSLGSRWLPDVKFAAFWTGAAGHRAELTVGTRVGLAFLDADPSKPVLVCVEPMAENGLGWNHAPDTSLLYANEEVTILGEDAVNINGDDVNLGAASALVVVNNAAFSAWVGAVSTAAMVLPPMGYTSTKVKA